MAEQSPQHHTEPGQPQVPAVQPADADLSDDELDQVVGGIIIFGAQAVPVVEDVSSTRGIIIYD